MNSPTTVLALDHVTLDLGRARILDNLSIDFWAGHVHAVIGPNGAGKSTMANVIMGLSGYRDFEGDVVFNGESLKGLAVDERARRGISLAWQEPARFEGLSVREFIGAAAKDQRERRIPEVLDQVGLNPDVYLDRAVDCKEIVQDQ
ncbi:MAG: ATP-binding cassette domain-containing protein, partial [Planctomycetota bacterium]